MSPLFRQPALGRALLLAFIALKLVVSFFLVHPDFDRHRDEFLHLDQGHHVAWGFVSVPPFTSWVSWAIHALGGAVFWVKFFPTLFGALTIAVVWYLVRSLGGGLFACALSATALLCSALLRLDLLFQPNSMDVLAWSSVLALMVQWLRTERTIWLYGTAAMFAIGFLNKYSIAFLGVGALAALLCTPQRGLLFRRSTLGAAALMLLLMLPNLLWQIHNGWPVLAHMEELNATQLVNNDRLAFLLDQPKMFFAVLPLLVAAIIALLQAPFARYRFLLWTFLFVLGLFTMARAKPYYALGLYPVLLGVGAVRLEAWLDRGWKRWLRPALLVATVLLFAPLVRIIFPVRSPERIAADKERLGKFGMLRWEDGRDHDLPQDFADMRGWRELARKVGAVRDGLGEEQPVLVLCDNYGEAGAINYYAPDIAPDAVSFNADYVNWFRLETEYRSVIYVQEAVDEDLRSAPPAASFESVTLVDSITDPFARERGTRIYRCTGPRTSINEAIRSELEKAR
jgi:hypothetical protein